MKRLPSQQRQHIFFVVGRYSHARIAECIESLTEYFSLTICCGHRQTHLTRWSQNHSIAIQYFHEDPKVPGYLQGLEHALTEANVIVTADLFSPSSFQALAFALKHSRRLFGVSEYIHHQFLAEAPNLRLVLHEFLTRADGIIQPIDALHWRSQYPMADDSMVLTLAGGLRPVSIAHWQERQARFRSWLKVGQDETIHTHVCDEKSDDYGEKLLLQLSSLSEEAKKLVRVIFVDENRLTERWKYLASDLKVGSRVFFLHENVSAIWSDLLCATDKISWSKKRGRSVLEESDALSHGAVPVCSDESVFGSITEMLVVEDALRDEHGRESPPLFSVGSSGYENRLWRAETLLQVMGATHKVRSTMFLNDMIRALESSEKFCMSADDYSWLLQIVHRVAPQDFNQENLSAEEYSRLKGLASLEVHHDLRVLAQARFMIARMMETGGQYSEAMAWYESSIAASDGRNSSVAIDSLLRLGAIALRLQSYEEASAIFKSVLAKDPGNAEACLGLGLGCLHRSLLEDSAAWLEKACQFAGTRDRAICCLVSLLNRPSMIYQAQRYYDRLLDEYPEEPRLVLGYSRYLDILGDSKASESVLSFLQTLPNK